MGKKKQPLFKFPSSAALVADEGTQSLSILGNTIKCVYIVVLITIKLLVNVWLTHKVIAKEIINEIVSFKETPSSLGRSNTPIDEDIYMKVLTMNLNSHSDEIIFNFSDLSKYSSSLLHTGKEIGSQSNSYSQCIH